jgi:hypothetical protein
MQGEVSVGVAGHAWHVTQHEWLVRMNVVCLRRAITSRMAVEAARMREHFRCLRENSARPLAGIGNRSE